MCFIKSFLNAGPSISDKQLARRFHEHSRPSSHLGEHLGSCETIIDEADFQVIDKTNDVTKLSTLDALLFGHCLTST